MKVGLICIFLLSFSLGTFSQTKLTKDSFYLRQTRFPTDYKSIVGDTKGWRALGHFDVNRGKIDNKLSSWDSLSVYTPFRDGTTYSKIRGNKIIGKGDKRVVYKVKYVDNATMILEYKGTDWIKNKKVKVHRRTLYRRRT